jgi:hypothetical protein
LICGTGKDVVSLLAMTMEGFFSNLFFYATLLKKEKVVLSLRGIKDEIIFDRMTISIS